MMHILHNLQEKCFGSFKNKTDLAEKWGFSFSFFFPNSTFIPNALLQMPFLVGYVAVTRGLMESGG